MSKVFVWRQYGDINIMDLNNPNLELDILETLKCHQVEVPTRYTMRTLLDLIDAEIESGSDAFQYGTGIYEIDKGEQK